MKSEIRFLNELDEDLAEAAWRESLKGTRRSRAVHRRPHRRIVVVLAGSVAFLTLAGGIGWFVMRGQGELGAGLPYRGPAAPQFTAVTQPSGAAYSSAPSTENAAQADQGATAGALGTQPASSAQGATLASLPSIQIAGDMTRIVKTGQVSIVVGGGTFEDKFREAGMIAARYHGYVQSSSASGGRSGTLTIRVPAVQFEAAMNAIAGLGTRVESQSVTGQNVTSQFVDLNARLSVWQQQLQVLRGLLGNAPSPEATIRYTNLIMNVQFRIEELKGQLRVLRNEADMSTIKVSLREEGAPVTTLHKPDLGNALQHAVAGFLGVVFAVVVGLGYLVPISALLAIAGLIFVRIRRRRAAA